MMLYAPVVLYCATAMTELANYGLLLFYVAFPGKAVADAPQRKPRRRIAGCADLSGWLMMLLCGLTVTLM